MIADVYFAQAQSGPIKIGWSMNVMRRLSDLQYGMKERVSLLATVTGDKRTEFYFHRQLKPHRITGEWFRPHQEVLSCVEDVKLRGLDAVPPDYQPAKEYEPSCGQDDDVLITCRDYCEAIAGPRSSNETVQDLIDRAAALTGMTRRKVKSLWYFEKVSVSAQDYIALRSIFEAIQARDIQRYEDTALRLISPRVA